MSVPRGRDSPEWERSGKPALPSRPWSLNVFLTEFQSFAHSSWKLGGVSRLAMAPGLPLVK